MGVKAALETIIRHQMNFLVGNERASVHLKGDAAHVLRRKKELLKERKAEIIKCDARVSVIRELAIGQRKDVDYVVHFQYFIRQKDLFYAEEEQVYRRAIFERGRLEDDRYAAYETMDEAGETLEREVTKGKGSPIPYKYSRLEAVKYAEAWWNGRNPAYTNFQDNCTNFISQCLHAGGSPMNGYPSVGRGWWQQNQQWSWSWSVAHSFQRYLTGATIGLRAQQVEKPEELLLGDVIAYDFENDGRWNHTTIVTAKDANGMPLVNAHSADSRRRYWAYQDSSKYTPQMKYKFFRILDNV
ncbi:amidase domain-containing protein [Bacillus sp. OTU530]|uniref:amidase domain-containing protein n=1 Tax=Bacillus sp. OTU530 TaxID=3043862 RepID=UPI00313E6BBF